MSWTLRQQRMLREMGIVLWQPPRGEAATPGSTGPDAAEPADPAVPLVADLGAAAAGTRRSAGMPRVQAGPVPDPAAAARAERMTAGASPTPTGSPPAAPAARAGADRTTAPDPAATAPPTPPRPAGPATDPTDEARRRRIAELDWPALHDAVASCEACGLCRTRRQTVFGVGHLQARWLVVGEAPGEQEDLQGEPFVGAAGQLLDAMLRALGLTRSADGDVPDGQRVYIANTLKCRPPRNRNPEPGEMLACEPFLLRQIDLLRPQMILAMGRFAVQALLRSSEPVGRLRGRVHRYHGVPLVVTYHPAYLLRNLPDKARAWEDLCLAAAAVGPP